MVNAQEWLNKNYPAEQRKHIKKLNLRGLNLEGNLDLSDFINLEELDCRINISNNRKLECNWRVWWANKRKNDRLCI